MAGAGVSGGGWVALVLAAGLGTRLRPLTADRPKALVEVGGEPLLELVLRRLEEAGCVEATVNAHHFAEQVAAYVAYRRVRSRMRVHLSVEAEGLLDTGGAVVAAGRLLEGRGPVLVHNVDVLSTIPLARLVADHAASGALATLAVQRRVTRRPLLFDRAGRLAGRVTPAGEEMLSGGPAVEAGGLERRAFTGISVLAPEWVRRVGRRGSFASIDAHLELAGRGEPIVAWDAGAWAWRDAGRPADLVPL